MGAAAVLAAPPIFCRIEAISASRTTNGTSALQNKSGPNGTRHGVCALSIHYGVDEGMLVERGLQVMSVETVADAYAIASNYLRKTGAIADDFENNDRLLEIIIALFQHGELNKIRLANKAIARFEAGKFEDCKPKTSVTA
jgi:hypothetical protein